MTSIHQRVADARGRDIEPPDFDARYQALVDRRACREPVALIVGTREFWGMEFEVTQDVLVPRPETELVVEEALAFANDHPCAAVFDVGTGSGCIAVAIAHELPHVRVVALDASKQALEVATRNVNRHGVADRVRVVYSDLFDQIDTIADLIVSNPPYVPASDQPSLPPEVRQYEPHSALFGGEDGLDVVRRLFNDAPRYLAAHGQLIVEFGFGQDAAVRDAATAAGWSIEHVRADLQGIARTIRLRANARS